ncbi:uncharacterized protein LOC143218762 isoform X4 [Lasioglossum baleicum]|uniref:uncharacterized protein LOC143218762 isoform X4 n=1 Tax=Lasioglossum baleicum TaxID=434251 RepID=UPI003FCC2B0B
MQYDCQCGRTTEKNTVDEFTAQRNDYLRKNVMVPIAWALARTLKYKPSDSLYYMTYELMRWKNINPEKKERIQNAIAQANVEMDHKLLMQQNIEKEELIKSKNEEALANIPCLRCKQHQELHVTKQACLKCMKKPRRKSGDCEFPEICSACKIEPSRKLEACQFSELCSSCNIANNPLNKSKGYGPPNCCDFCKHVDSQLKKCRVDLSPQICSSDKLADSSPLPQSERFEECQFPQVCSSCKVDDIESKNLEACEFPEVCSSCKITKP